MLLLLDVTVIDDLIHRYSVKLPLAGTARWIIRAQLGIASSGTGHPAGGGAGMPRDAARGASCLPQGPGCCWFCPGLLEKQCLWRRKLPGMTLPLPCQIGVFQPCGGHLYTSISPLIELFAGEDSRELNTYFLAV